MRKFLRTVGDTAVATKAKVVAALTSAIVLGTSVYAYAPDFSSATWGDVESLDTIIGSVLGIILGIASGVGIILLVFGIFRLILAFKDGNSNEQAQGIQLALVGAALVGLRTILNAAGLIG